jgi:predicted nucleic acid-binding protein
MTLAQAIGTMEKAELLWRNREYAVPSDDVLELTAKHNVSAYDAEFVVLARRLKIPLVTYDGPVKKLFPNIAVSPGEL